MSDNVRLGLSPDEVPTCEGLLSWEETLSALQGMARGKSPGSDGLPVRVVQYTQLESIRLGFRVFAIRSNRHESFSLVSIRYTGSRFARDLENIA